MAQTIIYKNYSFQGFLSLWLNIFRNEDGQYGQYDWNNKLNSSPLADHQNGQGHGRRSVKIWPVNPIAWSLDKSEIKLG